METRNRRNLLQILGGDRKKQMVFFTFSMILLILFYVVFMSIIRENRYKTLELVEDYTVLTDIERSSVVDKEINLSGWVLRLNAKNVDVQVILQGEEESDFVILNTVMEERNEVGEFFVPRWEFGKCGFLAKVKESKVKKDVCYKILLIFDSTMTSEIGGNKFTSRMKIFTGEYLYNGELYYYNPHDFSAPDVTDEELIQVINKGVLRVYDENEKIWIYQLQDKLYILTNPDFGSLMENGVKIPVMPMTSREDLLPEHRIQYGVDHLGAYFEDTEYAREGVLPYQVVCVELSKQYPSTYVSTGLYNTESDSWIKNFKVPVADWSLNSLDVDGE